MGRPYLEELAEIPTTCAAALAEDVSPLVNSLGPLGDAPLLAIGSGGSYSAAHFAAFLHQHFTCRIAKAITPLEALEEPAVAARAAVLCLSAGGMNADILAAFEALAVQEPRALLSVIAARNSRLATLGERYAYTQVHEFPSPSGPDGFLATNSLLATSLLLLKAYLQRFESTRGFPGKSTTLLGPEAIEKLREDVHQTCEPLWSKRTLVVIYSIPCQSAAVDLESKFTEAALGQLQTADFRNFAHGRHHWLAKNATDTAVLALLSDGYEDLCDRTLSALPPEVPTAKLHFPGERVYASIRGLLASLYIAGEAGEHRGIDPGRPGVPPFGSKVYDLGPGSGFGIRRDGKERAIERKAGKPLDRLRAAGELSLWEGHYDTFTKRLGDTEFRALVFDYDGTICPPEFRCIDSLVEAVAREMTRLLRGGVGIGIATGRGKSVARALRASLPQQFWAQVLVGYHNGAEIRGLDAEPPSSAKEPTSPLDTAHAILKRGLPGSAVDIGAFQVSVIRENLDPLDALWQRVMQLLLTADLGHLRVLRSSHSVDVLPPDISKLDVVRSLAGHAPGTSSDRILCVGDLGLWPGNDYELLSVPCSLSVDEVSTDPHSCWNLATPGSRGANATVEYLGCMKTTGRGTFIFQLNRQSVRARVI